jgi:hypothetical protein
MAQPGWYDDPAGRGGRRWWDGTQWTAYTSDPAQGTLHAQGTPSAPTFEASTPTSTGMRRGVAVASVVVLVVLLGMGGLLARSFLEDEGGERAATSGDGPLSFLDGGDELRPGESRRFSVGANATWDLEFTAPGGRLVIDVRGDDSFDSVARIEHADSRMIIDTNDDRGSQQVGNTDGGWADPLLDVTVSAGRYRLVVEGYNQRAGAGEVRFPVVGGAGS